MTTLLIFVATWIIIGVLFLRNYKRFESNHKSQEQIMDNSIKNESMTHNWTTQEGIKPNTIIYDFPNKLSATHDKTLNRLYVYHSSGMPIQEPINTNSITVEEFEEVLLGIEKL